MLSMIVIKCRWVLNIIYPHSLSPLQIGLLTILPSKLQKNAKNFPNCKKKNLQKILLNFDSAYVPVILINSHH